MKTCNGIGCRQGRTPEQCDCFKAPLEGLSFRAFWLAYFALIAAIVGAVVLSW